jgi:hypothetical protein
MDVIAAFESVGTYRGAAQVCGTTHKTVKRIVEAHEAEQPPGRQGRGHNYDEVAGLVGQRVKLTQGRISAKRLLPVVRAAGYQGSPRNFRRLVAEAKAAWRRDHHRGRRPGVRAPGETLIIDWGMLAGLHVFCAVLAWSRFRFVRFADNERAATTLDFLAECFEVLGGVPAVVLTENVPRHIFRLLWPTELCDQRRPTPGIIGESASAGHITLRVRTASSEAFRRNARRGVGGVPPKHRARCFAAPRSLSWC